MNKYFIISTINKKNYGVSLSLSLSTEAQLFIIFFVSFYVAVYKSAFFVVF